MVSGRWKLILKDTTLQRSSHVASVVDRKAFIFGGELVPREPRDNKLFEIGLSEDDATNKLAKMVSLSPASAPLPRVGSASATIGRNMYVFSGRGGIAMKPVDETGDLHEYDSASAAWNRISPSDHSSPYRPARSYHCMTSDGKSTIFLHAACPESGPLSDLWSFDLKERRWTQLPDAPAPQRGGTSIAYLDGRLYHMNGFDGKREQGGALDVFDLKAEAWLTEKFEAGTNGPEARSVSALLPLHINGAPKLLTLFGERDPSSLGHAGAGKRLEDWWVYDISSKTWAKGIDADSEVPAARGWFDADVLDGEQVVVTGGLNEKNERLDDVWLLKIAE